MVAQIGTGERLPALSLARLEDDVIRQHSLQTLLSGRRVIIVGVPGAFTPVCTQEHLPRFIELGPSLLRSGFDMILCVSGNDPWTIREWSTRLDPSNQLTFMSDGNLEFGRAMGLTTQLPDLFLGECLQRFVVVARNCIVEKVSVERSVLDVSRTSAENCRLAA